MTTVNVVFLGSNCDTCDEQLNARILFSGEGVSPRRKIEVTFNGHRLVKFPVSNHGKFGYTYDIPKKLEESLKRFGNASTTFNNPVKDLLFMLAASEHKIELWLK